jgi:hypothetical protein
MESVMAFCTLPAGTWSPNAAIALLMVRIERVFDFAGL